MLVLGAQMELGDAQRHKSYTKNTYGHVEELLTGLGLDSGLPQHLLLFFSLIATNLVDLA